MKQLVIKNGHIVIDNHPLPVLDQEGIIVETLYSAVSLGTEMAAVRSKQNPLMSAIKNPNLVSKVIDYAKKNGVMKTKELVDTKLSIPSSLGYSCAGKVVSVGSNVKNVEVGDLVACGGAEFANHSEYNYVPKNLFVKLPQDIDVKQAAYTTICSIALQGIRQADPKIGDNVLVVGLGILGNITMQILRANGINAVGIDVDKNKVESLKSKGFDVYNSSSSIVDLHTSGYGFDSVIITAAANDNGSIINSAFDMCRQKGTVVLVGVVNLNLDRSKMYMKELEFKISTSYGPGRYDNEYEIEGKDYPYGYVRWTENRNMQLVADLIAKGKIDLSDFCKNVSDISDAPKSYEGLKRGSNDHLIIEYKKYDGKYESLIKLKDTHVASNKINVGLIGAGNFVKSTHLPNLKLITEYNLYAVSDPTPINAKFVADKYGFSKIYSNYDDLINDPSVNLIFIGTRHENHAELVIKALKNNKHVFVEKPLCLTSKDYDSIVKLLKRSKSLLMVGHNRSYAECVSKVKSNLIGNKVIQYTVNAGYLPKDHWTQTSVGGGRVLGECVHFFDLFYYLVDSDILDYNVSKISSSDEKYIDEDNFSLNVRFKNGDIANLIYTALGSANLPKENIKVFNNQNVYEVKDFSEVYSYVNNSTLYKGTQNKGHYKELVVLKDAIMSGNITEVNYRLNNALKATKLALDITRR